MTHYLRGEYSGDISQTNKQNKGNIVALSPQANYTDRRPPYVGEVRAKVGGQMSGVAWSAHPVPMAVNLDFLDRSLYYLFK
jgi:hypothetical protein